MATPSHTKANATKPSPTANTRPNRLPAPTLFVGPPSRNTSQLSVSRQLTETSNKQTWEPLTRQKTALNRETGPNGPPNDGKKSKGTSPTQLRKPRDKSIDAKWREMQSTLNEVELTAQSSTHVFGEKHAAALDDLRKAQVELARAWGRGSDEKGAAIPNESLPVGGSMSEPAADNATDRLDIKTRKRGDTDASISTLLTDESIVSDATIRSDRSQMEDETAEDIRLASERRAANEAYFKKVDESVKEVVAKLEAVADAMRGVEGESRSLWGGTSTTSDSESRQRDSPAATTTGAV